MVPELLGTDPVRSGDLLAGYRQGESFFFASPRGTLLAHGAIIELPSGVDNLNDYVPEILAAVTGGGPPGVVVGALPFDDRAPAQLVVPARLRRSGPTVRVAGPAVIGPATGGPAVEGPELVPAPGSDPAEFTRGVATAVERIGRGELEKVVLARTANLVADRPVDVGALLHRLVAAEAQSHVFAVNLPGERILVGASPELLVRRHGRQVICHPLAGSVPRSDDPVEDARRAASLAAKLKDRHEHSLVVDGVVEALRPLCDDIQFPAVPGVIGTSTMWHLATRITATVRTPETSALVLARALHPTPAIGGVPVGTAQAAIAELESFGRGFYGGMVGWVDAAGDGEWALTIRCAEVSGPEVRLFAGAGIVAGSDPESELAETEAKFATLRRALGLTGDPGRAEGRR